MQPTPMMTMKPPITMMTATMKTANTKTTKICAPHCYNTTAFTLRDITPMPQSTANAAKDVEDNFPMIMLMMTDPMMMPPTKNTEKTKKPRICMTY